MTGEQTIEQAEGKVVPYVKIKIKGQKAIDFCQAEIQALAKRLSEVPKTK